MAEPLNSSDHTRCQPLDVGPLTPMTNFSRAPSAPPYANTAPPPPFAADTHAPDIHACPRNRGERLPERDMYATTVSAIEEQELEALRRRIAELEREVEGYRSIKARLV